MYLACETRYYDPGLGQFTQPDTIIPNPTNSQDFNRYTYVRNNPINYNDPTGHDACPAGGGGCGGVRQGDLDGDGIVCGGLTDCEIHRTWEPPEPIEVVRTGIDDPSQWCGSANCPSSVDPGHVFDDDSQAIAFLNFITSGAGGAAYGFADGALNSEELWGYYTTRSGNQAVRWKPGAGWVRRTTGLQAGQAVTIGTILKHGGRGLIAVGGALEGIEQWSADDGQEPGVRFFRSVAAGGTSALFTYGGASASMTGASAFCASAATVSCGGPWGTAAVVGVAGLVGGFAGNKAGEFVIEELLR